MSFYRIMLLHGVPTDLLDRVIVPNMARGTVRRLRDDFDELDGGEDALRWIGDRNGIRWDWKRWDRKQRGRLTEKLQELIDKGVFAVLQTTSFLPLLPAFHQVDGQWQITRDVRSLSHSAEGRFTLDLERRKREEQQREVWQGRNQPPTPEVLVAAAGPGFRKATLGAARRTAQSRLGDGPGKARVVQDGEAGGYGEFVEGRCDRKKGA